MKNIFQKKKIEDKNPTKNKENEGEIAKKKEVAGQHSPKDKEKVLPLKTKEQNKSNSKKNTQQPQSVLIYQFETPEFVQHERGVSWYVVFSSISIIILGYAILTRSPMTFLVCLLSFVVVLIVSTQDPKTVDVFITDKYIQFNKKLIPYSQIEFFGILYLHGNAFISIFLNTGMNKYLKIPLGSEEPEDIAHILSVFLERRDDQENLVDNLDQLLKL